MHQTEVDYRYPLELKLFFDAKSGQLLKRLEYIPLPAEQILELNDELYFVIHAPLDFAVNSGNYRRWQEQEQKTIARRDRGKPILLEGTAPESLLARPRKGPMLRTWYVFTSTEFLEAPREYRPFGNQGLFTAVVTLRSENGHLFEYVEGIAERVGNDYKLHKPSEENYRQVDKSKDWHEYHAVKEEGIGPYQIVEDYFWFGKISYFDLASPLGGFGYFDPYFDPDEKRYVLFRPRDIVGYSVSALLVEEKDVWLGLRSRG